MTNLKNKVNRLDWNVPIVTPNGSPTDEFQRKWLQQASTNASIPNLTTAAAVSAVIDLLSSVVGSMLVRGATQWQGLPPSANGKVLRDRGAGNTPQWDTLSTIIDLISNTQGAVLYRDAATWLALPPGTNGQVLTTQGAVANPLWATPASGGGAASIQDDGSNVYIALSDGDGQLVLDGSGDPIFVPEVFSPSALPRGVYPGVADNSVAGPGVVGESIATYNPFAAAVVMASGTPNDVASIVLQPGDYLVFGGSITKVSAGDTITAYGLWISDVSATFPADVSNKGAITLYNTTAVINNNSAFSAGCPMHFHVAAGTTKTVYLTGRIFFGVAASMSGYLEAIRLR